MDLTPFTLFARHQQGDPTVQAIGAVVIVGLCIIALFRELTSHYDVVTKSGAPYCPRCNRQVSFRRDHCRCCGYRFKTYGSPQAQVQGQSRLEALQAEAKRKARVAEQERLERAREAKVAEKAARRTARDDAYRAKGIEPGPLAWYKALPDVAQAIVLGLSMAIPTAAVLLTLVILIGQ